MILLIILGVLTLLAIVLFILDKLIFDTYWAWGVSLGGIMLFGAVLLGLSGVAIGKHSNIFNNKVRVECQERIDSLNNSRSFLEKKIESNTITVLEISSYNDSVREFKTELTQKQLELDSYWIGLYTCPAYNEFSPDAVSYLYVE